MSALPLQEIDIKLLSLLDDQPAHGYKLVMLLQKPTEAAQKPAARSSIYHSLHKLERQGFIQGKQQSNLKTPSSREYSLTEKGSRFLKSSLDSYIHLVHQSLNHHLNLYLQNRNFLARLEDLKYYKKGYA